MRPDFITVDMEYADRMLPSICSISIVSWKNDEIVDIFSSLINPDCEIESFLKDRHGITDDMVKNAPSLPSLWPDICKILDGNIVFMHSAARAFSSIIVRADVDYLTVPNLNYGCTFSLARRVWPGLDDYRLPNVTEYLGITKLHNHSLEDAKSVGIIVSKAMKEKNAKTVIELFNKVGFAGGRIKDNKKQIYRAVKNKKEKIFLCRVEENFFDISDFYKETNSRG